MSDADLTYLSGREALLAFRDRRLSPVELMAATIRRAEAIEPAINAFTETFFDRAMAAAHEAEALYVKGKARPLEGLPMAVKEEMRLAGTRRTSGSLLYKDRVDSETDVYVQRLLDAGAIPHLKTTTPEFCILGTTHSRLHGVTRNPWNRDLSPGGSSGGSAAALAAGAATLATGSDIGGSIRIPASCCGIAGYKPPYGRNPEIPVYNLDYYSHSGPLARSVADCALMQNATSGQHASDIASLRDKVVIDVDAEPDIRGWRIAYSFDLGIYEIEDVVRENMQSALEVFRDLGAVVEEVDLGWTRESFTAGETYLAHLSGADVARLLPDHRAELTDYAIAFGEACLATTAAAFFRANEVAVEMYLSFGPLMERFDLFVCPTLAIAAPPAEYGPPNDRILFNGTERRMRGAEWEITMLFNMLSRCPALSVPSGFAPSGVPTGVQIVGRAYHDEAVFTAGTAYERARPWLDRASVRPMQEIV